jgi:ubiquinone/menaquinone biosynthesis C-methylase UbiE
MDDAWYTQLAAAYVRGMLPNAGGDEAALIEAGRAAGLKLHRFKRSAELPRVRAVIGMLHGLAPESLLDVGSGRGVFLWPLLDSFPALPVAAIDQDQTRIEHIEAVRRGGRAGLWAHAMDAAAVEFADNEFDAVTVLEVLEHVADPLAVAREAIRVARRFVIATVPSKEDDNTGHIRLFDARSLSALFAEAGARRVSVEYVPGHMVCLVGL